MYSTVFVNIYMPYLNFPKKNLKNYLFFLSCMLQLKVENANYLAISPLQDNKQMYSLIHTFFSFIHLNLSYIIIEKHTNNIPTARV